MSHLIALYVIVHYILNIFFEHPNASIKCSFVITVYVDGYKFEILLKSNGAVLNVNGTISWQKIDQKPIIQMFYLKLIGHSV